MVSIVQVCGFGLKIILLSASLCAVMMAVDALGKSIGDGTAIIILITAVALTMHLAEKHYTCIV